MAACNVTSKPSKEKPYEPIRCKGFAGWGQSIISESLIFIKEIETVLDSPLALQSFALAHNLAVVGNAEIHHLKLFLAWT